MSVTGTASRISEPINTIALMPGVGILADAIGVELSNHGFNVIESSAMTALMARLNLDEFELTQPQSLEKLKEKNIEFGARSGAPLHALQLLPDSPNVACDTSNGSRS